MFIRKYWVPISVVLLVICAVGFFILAIQPPPEPIIIYKEVEVEKPTTEAPKAKPPPPGASPNGHWHGDEWHDAPHEETAPTPAVPIVKNTAPPGAATTPNFPPVDPNDDPVSAAYKRLDYIKNNPYAWGGVHSERATQLIAQLMPPPVLVGHDHGEEVYVLMEELIVENDPRAAAVLITNICEGSISTDSMENALVAIGPPAVPYILRYLEKGVTEGGMVSSSVFDTLRSIAVEHRADLGGITEHMIIPKIAEIASDKDFDRHDSGTVFFATAALSLLGQ